DGTREQRLARSRRPGEEDTVRYAPTEPAVPLRVAEEVDDLTELVLRLVDARDVGEGHLLAARHVAASARGTEGAEPVLHAARAAEQPEEQEDEEDRRSEAEQQALPPGRARVERLRIDGDLVVLEELRERVRVGEGRDLRPEEVGRLRAVVAL